jgi:hypothetical protein
MIALSIMSVSAAFKPSLSLDKTEVTSGEKIKVSISSFGGRFCTLNLNPRGKIYDWNPAKNPSMYELNTAGLNGGYSLMILCAEPTSATNPRLTYTWSDNAKFYVNAISTVKAGPGLMVLNKNSTVNKGEVVNFKWSANGGGECSYTVPALSLSRVKLTNDSTGFSIDTSKFPNIKYINLVYVECKYGTETRKSTSQLFYVNLPTSKLGSIDNDSAVLGAQTECTDITRNISRSDESNDTYLLQKFLKNQGLLSSEPTGYFGEKTVDAVKAYQGIRSLPQTGKVFEMTRLVIKSESCGE